MGRESNRLAFECNQDWDAMKPTACGRYCAVCRREVYDLTGRSRAEIEQLRAKEGEVCGMYTAEQLEDDLIGVELSFLSRTRYYAAVLAAFLGIETAYASAGTKHSPKIVMTESFSSNPETKPGKNPTGRDSRMKKQNRLFKKHVKQKPDDVVKKKKKVYLSKRFPFIHIRRRHVLGRMKF